MTCKDCLHFSRCKEMYENFGVFIDLENSAVCKHFKTEAKTILLSIIIIPLHIICIATGWLLGALVFK